MKFAPIIVSARRAFVEVQLETADLPLLERIKDTTRAKLPNTDDSWQKRSLEQKAWDLFSGDLARCIVAAWLRTTDPLVDRYLIEYDNVRTDSFKHLDKFDIQVLALNVEVKSSNEKTIAIPQLSRLLTERRIIINKRGAHEKVCDAVVQVNYLAPDPKLFEELEAAGGTMPPAHELFERMERVFETHLLPSALSIKAYLTAWVDKGQQLSVLETLAHNFTVKNVASRAQPRTYADLKLGEANDIFLLQAYLRELMRQQKLDEKYCNQCGALLSEADRLASLTAPETKGHAYCRTCLKLAGQFDSTLTFVELVATEANFSSWPIANRILRALLLGNSHEKIIQTQPMKEARVTKRNVQAAEKYIAEQGGSVPL